MHQSGCWGNRQGTRSRTIKGPEREEGAGSHRRVQGLGLLPPQVDGSREGAAVRAQGRRRDADCRVWGGCREGPGQEGQRETHT